MSSESKKCAHPACKCMVPPHEGAYCSQYCKDAKKMTEMACGCPHEGCRGHI
jgi:hypothetical protein